MLDVQPEQARTLAAIVTHGSFDAAAASLLVTPSAVSQRVRALEVAVGRPVLRRTRPIELTDSGQAVVRFARQLELLSADLADELEPLAARATPRLVLVVNSDSLDTWAMPALAEVSDVAQLEVLREDQAHSLDLLRSGAASAAITATATPVPGCTSSPLGTMRYRPACTPAFADRWFEGGVTDEALERAPVVVYDRRDDLQDQYLRSRGGAVDPPRHHIPATHAYGNAVRFGMGWGMLPETDIDDDVRRGLLRPLDPGARIDVMLYWQQWRYGSKALAQVAAAFQRAAGKLR